MSIEPSYWRPVANTPAARFEDAIREMGVVAACEWFGYAHDSDFTKETIRVLAERATPKAGESKGQTNDE